MRFFVFRSGTSGCLFGDAARRLLSTRSNERSRSWSLLIIGDLGLQLFWCVIIRRGDFGWSRGLFRRGFLLRRLRFFWLRFPNQTFPFSFATNPVSLRYLNTRGMTFYFDAKRVTERESLIVGET